MTERAAEEYRLVSQAEVATLVGVERQAVANWQRRYPNDFPRPAAAGEPGYFHLADIVAWLEQRKIPSNVRVPGEVAGVTYADRLRRALANGGLSEEPGAEEVHAAADLHEESDQRPELTRLADRLPGSHSEPAYLNLLACLVYLRRCAPVRWQNFQSRVVAEQARGSSPGPGAQLLRTIGQLVDEDLRTRGVVGGMRTVLTTLEPRSVDEVAQDVQLSTTIDRDGFADLLNRHAEASRLAVEESPTPRSVAHLMARALTAGGESKTWSVVYDPYARTGELLAAVADHLGRPHALTMVGEGRRQDLVALAGINLALRSATARLQISSSAPWNTHHEPREADLVVVNPPFNASGAAPTARWEYGPPPPTNNNYAWVQHVLASLKDDGRAAVLLPNTATVSTHPREQGIRRALVTRGALEAVIALPGQLFPGTPIAACLLLLRCPTERREPVLFIDARSRGRRTGPVRTLDDTTLHDIEQALLAHRDPCSTQPQLAGFAEVCDPHAIDHECSIYPAEYVTPTEGALSSNESTDRVKEARMSVHDAAQRAYNMDQGMPDLEDVATTGPWRQIPLGELCDVQAGPSHTYLKGEVSPDGNVPIVLPKHLRDRQIVPGTDRVSQRTAAALQRFHLQPGDIVCIRSGTPGQAAMVDDFQGGWLYSTNLVRLHRYDLARVDPTYLLAYLSRPEIVKRITDRAGANVIPFINAQTLAQLPVVLPPLSQQHQVAAALRAVDEQISAHRDLADTLDVLRTTLVEQLLSEHVTIT